MYDVCQPYTRRWPGGRLGVLPVSTRGEAGGLREMPRGISQLGGRLINDRCRAELIYSYHAALGPADKGALRDMIRSRP